MEMKRIGVIKEGKLPGKPYLYYGAQNWYGFIKCEFESQISPEVNINLSKIRK